MISMMLRLVFPPWRGVTIGLSEPLVIENRVSSNRASRAKFHWGIAFATGLKRYTDPVTKLRMKHTNRRVWKTEWSYLMPIEAEVELRQTRGGDMVLIEGDDDDFKRGQQWYLTKGNVKRKGVDETCKQGSGETFLRSDDMRGESVQRELWPANFS
ncbi:hypothetical protein Tco_1329514 [Tanacetum coccineum]